MKTTTPKPRDGARATMFDHHTRPDEPPTVVALVSDAFMSLEEEGNPDSFLQSDTMVDVEP